ncbi:hypothetical protein ABTX80_07120 [Streptomyces erythrochromogenes]|uniref:hypothetical protein n=1 Tax=Streptomyces erythrochromogenes TaxID=285574 RepID=UPI003327669C
MRGVLRTEAEARLRELEPLFAEFAVGEEELVATVLSFGHVFIVDRVLDEHEKHIRDLLGSAAGTRGGYPGGLLGWFRTGELTKIFLFFAKTRFRGGRGWNVAVRRLLPSLRNRFMIDGQPPQRMRSRRPRRPSARQLRG